MLDQLQRPVPHRASRQLANRPRSFVRLINPHEGLSLHLAAAEMLHFGGLILLVSKLNASVATAVTNLHLRNLLTAEVQLLDGRVQRLLAMLTQFIHDDGGR